MKWMRGYGTRLVWNSVISTFKAPSKRSDAVKLEIICAMRRFRLVYVGRSMSKFLDHVACKVACTILYAYALWWQTHTHTAKCNLNHNKLPAANVIQSLVVVPWLVLHPPRLVFSN